MAGNPNFANTKKTTRNANNIQNNKPKSGVNMAGKLCKSNR